MHKNAHKLRIIESYKINIYKIITKSIDKHEIMCYNTDKNRTETPDRTGGVPTGLTARIAIKNQRKDVLPMQRYKGG